MIEFNGMQQTLLEEGNLQSRAAAALSV